MSLKNQTINVLCEKIVFPGRSLCRCQDGIALFTEGLLPDEKADVLVIKDKKSFREGILKKITKPSCKRIEPKCSSFGRCGGCTFQNTDYENQADLKQFYIEELLKPFEVKVEKVLKSPVVWNYRNKMEFSFFNVENKTELGLHCKGSFNRYISVPPCYIADEDFIKAAEIVKKFANEMGLPAYNNRAHEGFFRHLVLRKAQNNNQFLINIVTNVIDCQPVFFEPLVKELGKIADSVYWTQNGKKSDAVLSDKTTLLLGKTSITEKLNIGNKDYFFKISPFSFFQTNSKGTEILYNKVLNLLNLSKNDILLDLYCGTGTIGISLAGSVKKVIGIEHVKQAIDDAKENSKLNNVDNIEFFALTAEDWVEENNNIFDAIVVDPPRSGLTNNVIKFLLSSSAKKIIYVSCNPSTLARDLALITENNLYNINTIVPVDMFPQTYHIESIALLEKR